MKKIKAPIKKVFIHTEVVCERRKLDSQLIAHYFKVNNYRITTNPKKADVIILTTCGADTFSAECAFKAIEKFKKYDAELIVAGCLPDTDHDKFHESYEGKYVCTKNIKKIDEYFSDNKVKFDQLDDTNKPWINIDKSKIYDLLIKTAMKSRLIKKFYVVLWDNILKIIFCKNHLLIGNPLKLPTDDRYFIRIAWGCFGNCSYCAIKLAVGKFRSKPIKDCVKELDDGVKNGVKKFYITAEDTGAYGKDADKTFPELLKELIKVKGDYTVAIYALNPVWLVKYIDELEEIVKTGKITGFCIPIQSGSSRILKMMNRYSNTDKIKESLIRLKKAKPDLDILTHIIFGFPSESMDDYIATLNFLEETDFSSGLLIPMSVKGNTQAEKIEPKIDKKEILRRLKYGQKFLKHSGYNMVMGGYFGGKKAKKYRQ